MHLPLLTASLPGVGGAVEQPEDFEVQELPAYLPCGEGEHCMAQVRKRGLTTPEAVRRVCEALGLAPGTAGYAGLKDKQGVTTQWISVAGATPKQMMALGWPDLQVLQARLHRNKLRTGHLRGNRFTVQLRGTAGPGALQRARDVMDVIAARGLPNFFGAQRFGRRGDNAEQGLLLLRKQRRPPRDKRQRRLLISALQSLLFNEVVARRLEQGCLDRLLGGEVLQKTDSGGIFVSEDAALDGPRLERGEVVVTGPLVGPRTPWPLPGSAALALEQEVLAAHEVTAEQFSAVGRLARGGRRPATVRVEDPALEDAPEVAGLRLRFCLPPGSYATVLLAEVCKPSRADS